MTPSAVDIVNERWLVLEEGAHARQLAGFGGLMDRMILGRGRGHEPSRRINHVRGSYYLPEIRASRYQRLLPAPRESPRRPPREAAAVRPSSLHGSIPVSVRTVLVRKLLAGWDGKVVSRTFASWNWLEQWLRQIEGLRRLA